MLSVIDAVKIATSQLLALIPEAEDVLLEEVEISDDNQFWMVTLGFAQRQGPLAQAVGLVKPRKYKVFKIDGTNGEVRSMKIREGANV